MLDELHGGPVEIAGVVSSREDAGGLERASQAGVETAVFPISAHPDRAARTSWRAWTS